MATDAEQRFLVAMASLGNGAYSAAEVSAAWGSTISAAPHRIARA